MIYGDYDDSDSEGGLGKDNCYMAELQTPGFVYMNISNFSYVAQNE